MYNAKKKKFPQARFIYCSFKKYSQTIERGQAIKRAITRFTKWAKEHNIRKKSDITEEAIQLYQLDLNDDPKQYSVATIHTYLAPICKAVDINMNRIRKDKRSSDKIIRGRVKSKNSQGKHQETDSRFSRLVNFQRAVGIRRSELKKIKRKRYSKR